MAPTKQQQIAEARKNNTQQRSDNEVPSEPVDDNTTPDAVEAVAPKRVDQQTEPEVRRSPTVQSPKDLTREEIARNFRQFRNQQAVDDDAEDINRFTRSGMPPELLALEDEVPEDNPPLEGGVAEELPEEVQQEEIVEEPRKIKLVVRGKEMEVTEEEYHALAQKAAAADDYFDETKRKLKEADELLRTLKAGRDSQAASTHAGPQQTNTQEGQVDPTLNGGEQHVDPYEKVVETIQFGDQKEAARLLREISLNQVDTRKIAAEQLEQERMRNEAIRSQKILKDFESQHPDLAKDQYALAAMRARLIELQTSDLKALGLDESQLPKTGEEIANWHMWYRQKGHSVRDVDVLLKTARDDFMKWKGVQEKPAATTNAPPRVEVTVDRQQRRAAIQQQPSRTVAPKPDQITQQAPRKDRSSVVQEMIAARGRPRQKVIVQ